MKKLLVKKNVYGFGRNLRKGEYLDPALEQKYPGDFRILYGMDALDPVEVSALPPKPKKKSK